MCANRKRHPPAAQFSRVLSAPRPDRSIRPSARCTTTALFCCSRLFAAPRPDQPAQARDAQPPEGLRQGHSPARRGPGPAGHDMGWDGTEWNGTEWNGMEWNGMRGLGPAFASVVVACAATAPSPSSSPSRGLADFPAPARRMTRHEHRGRPGGRSQQLCELCVPCRSVRARTLTIETIHFLFRFYTPPCW